MKEKIGKIKTKIIKTFKYIKEEQVIRNYFKNNALFVAFLIVNLLNATLLRFLTMGITENLTIRPVMADLAVLIIVGSFGYLFKPKNRFTYYMVFTTLFTLICLINSVYYTFYTSFASVSMLALAQFIGPVGDAVVESVLQLKDLVYLVPLLAFIIVHIKLKRKNYYKKVDKKKIRKKHMIKTLVAGIALAVTFILTMTSLDASRFSNQWNREFIVMRFGIYTYQLNDVVASIRPRITAMFGHDQAMRDFLEFFENREEEVDNEFTNILYGRNIIAIHAESIQRFTMELEFNGYEVTPNLNRLAREGMFFDNFYAPVGAGTSSDSELLFHASLMPTQSGTAFVSFPDRYYVTIPRLLKEKGYYTFSMHANNADFWNRRVMHQNFGFNRFFARDSYHVTPETVIGLGLSDEEFFRQSIPMIQEIADRDQPFYGLMITLTNHTPFSDLEAYGPFDVSINETRIEINEHGEEVEVEVVYPFMEDTRMGNYLKSVRYADEQLGLFMELMEEAGLLENTVIVIYGDHDARLPRRDFVRLFNYDRETNGVFGRDHPDFRDFDSFQYELYRSVPLIIWTHDGILNDTISYPMSLLDITPTLGNMFGFRNEFALGRDIFNIRDDNIVVFPNGNWLTRDIYYNSQRGEYLSIHGNPIGESTVAENTAHAIELLDISNRMIVFDLVRHFRESQALLNPAGSED